MLLRACKNQLILQRGDFLVMALVALGAVALGEGVTTLVMVMADPEDYFMLAPFLLFLVAGLTTLVLSAAYWMTVFPMGVRMGATRREMVAGTLCLTVVMNLMLFGFVALSNLLERTLGVGYWVNTVGKELEIDPLYLVPGWAWPLLVVGCTLGGLLAGTVVLRFGRKGFWVLWGAWMVLALLPQFLPDDFNLPIFPPEFWMVLPWLTAAAVVVLSLAAVWLLLRLPLREE